MSRFKRRHNTAYINLSSEGRTVDSETVEHWKNYRVLQEIEDYDLCDTNNADETGQFSVYNLEKPPLFEDNFAMVAQNLNSWVLCSSHAVKMVVINLPL
jgi:hypothetical protein